MRTVTIPKGCRECFVSGEPAIFHRWAEKETLFLQFRKLFRRDEIDLIQRSVIENNTIPNGVDCTHVKNTLAIVECLDGEIKLIEPDKIQFIRTYESAVKWWQLDEV